MTADRLDALIVAELAMLDDPAARSIIDALRVAPVPHLYDWDYGPPGQQYPCWMVLMDPQNRTGIGYCEQGFGPERPWGLLWIGDPPRTRSMGQDSGWFPTFLEAFFESFSAPENR